MHIEILIEDQSSCIAMEALAAKLLDLGDGNTFRIHPYRGIGRIPEGLKPKTDASKRILLDRLPQLLKGYGKNPFYETVIIICDLDDRDKESFLLELNSLADSISQKPKTLFVLSIEEFEAWYLGDIEAIRKAYPAAKLNVLSQYKNDSICGTWEVLADAVYKGGSDALKRKGWQAVGEQKSVWAKKITPFMDINRNSSPSFNEMRVKLKSITALEV